MINEHQLKIIPLSASPQLTNSDELRVCLIAREFLNLCVANLFASDNNVLSVEHLSHQRNLGNQSNTDDDNHTLVASNQIKCHISIGAY